MVGDNPRRAGSGSQAAQPAGVYPSADGEFMLTIGNEGMYQRFCENVIERPDMAGDTRFATNAQRLVNKSVADRGTECRLCNPIERGMAGAHECSWHSRRRD